MRALFSKIRFVWRFLLVKFYYYPQVRLTGFVFIEQGVIFKVEPKARITLANRVYLKAGAILECSGEGRMVLEERANIGHYAWMGCQHTVIIHHDAFIGQSCTISDAKHIVDKKDGINHQGYDDGHCEIGHHTLVFPRSSVGPNVTVAEYCQIMPHSIVLKDITEPGTKFVKHRA